MSNNIGFKGMGDFEKSILKMANDNEKAVIRGVNAGAYLTAEKVREAVPKNSGRMADSLTVQEANKNGVAFVYFNKDTDGWYAHIQELGSIKHRPQSFVAKTIARYHDEIVDVMVREFKKGLGL